MRNCFCTRLTATDRPGQRITQVCPYSGTRHARERTALEEPCEHERALAADSQSLFLENCELA